MKPRVFATAGGAACGFGLLVGCLSLWRPAPASVDHEVVPTESGGVTRAVSRQRVADGNAGARESAQVAEPSIDPVPASDGPGDSVSASALGTTPGPITIDEVERRVRVAEMILEDSSNGGAYSLPCLLACEGTIDAVEVFLAIGEASPAVLDELLADPNTHHFDPEGACGVPSNGDEVSTARGRW